MANNNNNNNYKPIVSETIQTKTLQASYVEHMNASQRIDDRTPYNGTLDKFSEVRLRIAVIDNHEIKRPQYSKIDPLDIKNIINLNTGNVVLRWVDMPGGILRSENTDGKWEHNKKYEDSSGVNKHEDVDEYQDGTSEAYKLGLPENRDYDEWTINSRREMVQLTHPFIWADSTNYCGMNYIPPVGSKVIVGFKKQGMPIILGYIPTHYAICKPVLKPGEIVMKGYGNNYIHWRQSDKLDMKVWTTKGNTDNDDYEKHKVSKQDCTLWLRLNANDRFIRIAATGPDPNDKDKKKSTSLILKPESIALNAWDETGNFTKKLIKPDSIKTTVSSSKGSSYTEHTAEAFTINTSGTFKINAKVFEINATTMNNNTNTINSTTNSFTVSGKLDVAGGITTAGIINANSINTAGTISANSINTNSSVSIGGGLTIGGTSLHDLVIAWHPPCTHD